MLDDMTSQPMIETYASDDVKRALENGTDAILQGSKRQPFIRKSEWRTWSTMLKTKVLASSQLKSPGRMDAILHTMKKGRHQKAELQHW